MEENKVQNSDGQRKTDDATFFNGAIGYILLETFDIEIFNSQLLPKQEWLAINYKFLDGTHLNGDSCEISCFRCSPVIKVIYDDSDKSKQEYITLGEKHKHLNFTCKIYCPSFDGTSVDLPSRCSETCVNQFKREQSSSRKDAENQCNAKNLIPKDNLSDGSSVRIRSDASLLLGAVLWNERNAYLKVKSFQLLLHPIRVVKNESKSRLRCVPASIVMTFTIPKKHKCNIQLPPSTQMLYAIIRSDWDWLDSQMKILKENVDLKEKISKENNAGSIFPSALKLEELYRRIQTSLHHEEIDSYNLQACNANLELHENESKNCLQILSLPADIIMWSIAKYLHAKPLDTLRCTCKHFYMVLRQIVPGLSLKLYRHQITSLAWMRQREKKDIYLNDIYSDIIRRRLLIRNRKNMKELYEKNVTKNKDDNQVKEQSSSAIIVDTNTGEQCGNNLETKGLIPFGTRGGFLCDDPGLGKTITLLSLILQTYGLSSAKLVQKQKNIASIDEDIVETYWKILGLSQIRLLARVVNFMHKQDKFLLFEKPPDETQSNEHNEKYNDIIQNPICFQDIKKKVQKMIYAEDLKSFYDDMMLCFQNAKKFHRSNEIVRTQAENLQQEFQVEFRSFKTRLVDDVKEYYGNKDETLSEMLNLRTEIQKFQSLTQSSSTLLVVPPTLINHWQEQILLHVNFKYCTTKIPIFHVHSSTNTTGNHVRFNLKSSHVVTSYDLNHTLKLIEEGAHEPCVFFDKCNSVPLPTSDVLSLFPIVITSTSRLSREWRNGSLEKELERSSKRRRFSKRYVDFECNNDDLGAYGCDNISEEAHCCPLLKVHWLRLVIDEGHVMGKTGLANSIEFASWIHAQRRWIMSGTPTPQTSVNNGLHNIWNLIRFLKFSSLSGNRNEQKIWKEYIVRPWIKGNLIAFFRLQSLLSTLMVRHLKSVELCNFTPYYKRTYIQMSQSEITAYNTLITIIRSNIIITSMEGKSSGWTDSLLNPTQASSARQAIRNLRIVCCGGVRIRLLLTHKNRNETLKMLKDDHNVNELNLKVVDNFLTRATFGEVSSCMFCGFQLQFLFVLPCAHFICIRCVNIKQTFCPVCDKEFNIDEFQKLQPGFKAELEYIHNNTAENVQPVLNLDDGRRPQMNRRMDHVCVFPSVFTSGKCQKCFREHDNCNLLNPDSKCYICYRPAEDCPSTESKASQLIQKLLQLRREYINQMTRQNRKSDAAKRLFDINTDEIYRRLQQPTPQRSHARPLKAVIFSQFREILNIVGNRLILRFGTACVAEYWGRTRADELRKFQSSSDCFCILLGKDGSHGLDLSFVTHIFFLEQVWDKSLEQQVVARAYRMGATGAVHVELLIAKNTVEELMIEMDQCVSNVSYVPKTVTHKNLESTKKPNATAKVKEGCDKSLEFQHRDDTKKKTSNMKVSRKVLKEINGDKTKNGVRAESAIHQAKLHYVLTNIDLIELQRHNPFAIGKKKGSNKEVRFTT